MPRIGRKQTATGFFDKPVCNLRIFEAHLCLKSSRFRYVLLKSQVEGTFIKIAGCVSFVHDDYGKTKQHVIHLHDFVVIVSKQNPWDAGAPSATLLSHHNGQDSAFAKVLHLQCTANSWREAGTRLAIWKLLDWLWCKWRPQPLPNWSQLLVFLTCLVMFGVCAFKHRENPNSVVFFINGLKHIISTDHSAMACGWALSWN